MEDPSPVLPGLHRLATSDAETGSSAGPRMSAERISALLPTTAVFLFYPGSVPTFWRPICWAGLPKSFLPTGRESITTHCIFLRRLLIRNVVSREPVTRPPTGFISARPLAGEKMIRPINPTDRLRQFWAISYQRILENYYNMAKTPNIPDIPEHERTTPVAQLLEVIHYQTEMIQSLRDEIAVLKGETGVRP